LSEFSAGASRSGLRESIEAAYLFVIFGALIFSFSFANAFKLLNSFESPLCLRVLVEGSEFYAVVFSVSDFLALCDLRLKLSKSTGFSLI